MKNDLNREDIIRMTRRDFLATSASGIGTLAFASLLRENGLLAAQPRTNAAAESPSRSKSPHFPAKAKNCICIYMEGAPSQMDTLDPKPNSMTSMKCWRLLRSGTMH